MRFANVDGQKIGVVFVVVVDLDDVANLATKRRSGETAEDENERFARGAFANVEMIGAIEGDETRIGSGVAGFQITAVHVRQRVAHHEQRVFGTASHDAERDEGEHGERADRKADPHEHFPQVLKLLATKAARDAISALRCAT